MRSKEDAQDYRYFPDPDLPPLRIGQDWIEQIAASMPELPNAMRARFVRDLGLLDYDATVLTQSKASAQLFEDIVAITGPALAKATANLMMGDIASSLNRAGLDYSSLPLNAAQLALLLQRVADNTISNKIAKEVLAAMWEAPNDDPKLADQVIEAKGLKQITDIGALEKIIDEVMAANQQSVDEFRAGKEKAFNSLVGQAMKATKGKGNPAQVNEILRNKLAG